MVEQRLWTAWRDRRDERAFEALVAPHLRFAVDLARRLGCGPADADDLVQRSLVSLVTAQPERPARVGVRAWIGRRIVLDAKTLHRAAARRKRHESRLRPQAATAVAAPDARDEIDSALSHLNHEERHAVVLRFLHDLDYADVAHVLGCSTATARVRVHRAVARLRKRLGRNAPALLATCALLGGTGPVHASHAVHAARTLGGVVVMSNAVKTVTAVIVLAFLAWMVWPDGDQGQKRTQRAEQPATKEIAGPVPADGPRDEAERDSEREPENTPDADNAFPDVEWRSYDSSRKFAKIKKNMRGIRRRVDLLGGEKPSFSQQADATTQLYLEELMSKYKELPETTGRFKLFRTFVTAHHRYLVRTSDLSFLPFLESIARMGAKTERPGVAAALSGLSHATVIDALLRLSRAKDVYVRSAAIEALAEVEGSDAPRAHRTVERGLTDDGPSARWAAAMAIEYVIGKPRHVQLLLERIPNETHAVVMHALIHAILALDKTDGQARLDSVLAAADPAVRSLAERAMARKPSNDPNKVRFLPLPPDPEGSDPNPDDAVTTAYLKRLADEYATMAAGDARTSHLHKMMRSAADHLRTYDSFLDRLDAIVQGPATAAERQIVIGAMRSVLRKTILDQVVAWGRSSNAEIRVAAISVLASVSKERHKVAHETAIQALRDPETNVRRAAAYAGSQMRGDDVLPALLDAVAHETEYVITYGLVRSILAHDKEGGEKRIEDATTDASSETKVAVRRALQSLLR